MVALARPPLVINVMDPGISMNLNLDETRDAIRPMRTSWKFSEPMLKLRMLVLPRQTYRRSFMKSETF